MKLKVLKPHYYESRYRYVGNEYMCDKKTGESHVRLGICEEIEAPKRERKTKEKKINIKTK